ncbi:transcription initiation factor TFIID subunit 11 [Drosophila mojavensis]|uniref:Uncharacterized protein n=1 Tax=Drosophila mojavensis TaxID=7230 RepID=B4L5E8_DROMO|nr:transcription initiation factor TFIID subunit 11 [Drosophila mojavensis]EDW06407.2 uncharacterized protein Dmoj_GI21531 [Drosophila mojavensis]
MLLQSIFAPLWQPVKDQLGLFRALATGGRIPGTNLILMPVAAGKCRFGFVEHFMMALAGAWLLFCVIYRELKDVKPTKRQQHKQPYSVCCIAWNERDTDTDMDTETTITTTTTTTTITTTTTTADTGTSSQTEDTANQTDQNEETIDGQLMIHTDGVLGDGTEATFYWGCHQLHRPEPIFRFTRLQLEKMLRMDQDESDDDYEDDSDDDIVPDSDDKVDDSQSNSNRDMEDRNLDSYESINEK